jgi:hypothetical protein
MRSTHSKPDFLWYRDNVSGLMRAGEPFGEVEDAIDQLVELTQDQKAALWLLAFSMRDRREQERDARAHIAALATS